jgi:hypothetical protein
VLGFLVDGVIVYGAIVYGAIVYGAIVCGAIVCGVVVCGVIVSRFEIRLRPALRSGGRPRLGTGPDGGLALA